MYYIDGFGVLNGNLNASTAFTPQIQIDGWSIAIYTELTRDRRISANNNVMSAYHAF